jgi:hypothetical protein
MILKDIEFKYEFTGDWGSGIILFDPDNAGGRYSVYTERYGLLIPPQKPWPITLYALTAMILDSGGVRRNGTQLRLVGMVSKQWPVLLKEEVQTESCTAAWVGEIPLLYGFGIAGGALSGDMLVITAGYSPRRELRDG